MQLAAAQQASCAILSDGTAKCWGSNTYGQLGNGTNVGSGVPVTVSGLANAVAIDMSNAHVCALLASGGVRCWGYNFYGQLGNGNAGANAGSNVPVAVMSGFFDFPLANAISIGVGVDVSVGGGVDAEVAVEVGGAS